MPDVATYDFIAGVTSTSGATSITFSSIPGTYTDLVLISNASVTSGSQDLLISYNDDTTDANYQSMRVGAKYSTLQYVASDQTAFGSRMVTNWGYPQQKSGCYVYHILNYAETTMWKHLIGHSMNPTATTNGMDAMVHHLWENTSAITKIVITPASSSFTSSSNFSLYGITKA